MHKSIAETLATYRFLDNEKVDFDSILRGHRHATNEQIKQQAKQHNPVHLKLLKSVHGIGRILALTILYEIGDVNRFETVQQFASYSRLVKCKAESAGKSYGTQGAKIGNAHLKWAFSEAAVLYLRGNKERQKYLEKLQRHMSKVVYTLTQPTAVNGA